MTITDEKKQAMEDDFITKLCEALVAKVQKVEEIRRSGRPIPLEKLDEASAMVDLGRALLRSAPEEDRKGGTRD